MALKFSISGRMAAFSSSIMQPSDCSSRYRSKSLRKRMGGRQGGAWLLQGGSGVGGTPCAVHLLGGTAGQGAETIEVSHACPEGLVLS